MTSFQNLWNAALGRPAQPDFQPSQGNRRRLEIYDALIGQAQLRAESAPTVEARRRALQLIFRLESRCMREVERRERQTRA